MSRTLQHAPKTAIPIRSWYLAVTFLTINTPNSPVRENHFFFMCSKSDLGLYHVIYAPQYIERLYYLFQNIEPEKRYCQDIRVNRVIPKDQIRRMLIRVSTSFFSNQCTNTMKKSAMTWQNKPQVTLNTVKFLCHKTYCLTTLAKAGIQFAGSTATRKSEAMLKSHVIKMIYTEAWEGHRKEYFLAAGNIFSAAGNIEWRPMNCAIGRTKGPRWSFSFRCG